MIIYIVALLALFIVVFVNAMITFAVALIFGWLFDIHSHHWIIPLTSIVLHIIYWEYTSSLASSGHGASDAFRTLFNNQWLIDLRQRFTDGWKSTSSLKQLKSDGENKQYMFLSEPHGPATLGVVCGFALHCCSATEESSHVFRNTRIVTHWIHRYIPVVRSLFCAAGCISNKKDTVVNAIKAGFHTVIVPSGITGLQKCLEHARSPIGQRTNCVIVHRHKLNNTNKNAGCFALAIKHKLHIVPMLSFNTNQCWFIVQWFSWLPWSMVHVKREGQRVSYDLSATIDCSKYKITDVQTLAENYYKALQQIGKQNNIKVIVTYV